MSQITNRYPFPQGEALEKKKAAALARQQEHTNGGDAEIVHRVHGASARINQSALSSLLDRADAALLAGRPQEHIKWLRKACDTAARPLESVSACKTGCSHCCHIAVAVTEPEAQLIAKHSGRKLATPVDNGGLRHQAHAEKYYGHACPFLDKQRCSIYEHRPIACRTHLSADRDALLCELLDPEQSAPSLVPYVDLSFLKFRTITGADIRIADIREWFPV